MQLCQGVTRSDTDSSPNTAGDADLLCSGGAPENTAAVAINVGETITAEGHPALYFIPDTDPG